MTIYFQVRWWVAWRATFRRWYKLLLLCISDGVSDWLWMRCLSSGLQYFVWCWASWVLLKLHSSVQMESIPPHSWRMVNRLWGIWRLVTPQDSSPLTYSCSHSTTILLPQSALRVTQNCSMYCGGGVWNPACKIPSHSQCACLAFAWLDGESAFPI